MTIPNTPGDLEETKDPETEDEKDKRDDEDHTEDRGGGEGGEAGHGGQTVTTYMVVPPDGGWGWVIVASSFCCNIVVDGIIFTFGTFLKDLAVSFNASEAQVSLVGSLLSGFYLITGPFVSALANRYGFRCVTILGSILGCISFILASFSTSLWSLCFFYGILGGVGFGLIYVPAVITTGFYFERWRALATGIAVCGSGIGTFLMAHVGTYLQENFGWRGSFIIQGGFILNCAVLGALFRPLKPVKVVIPSDVAENLEDARHDDLHEPDGKLPLLVTSETQVPIYEISYEEASIHGSEKELEITATEPLDPQNTFLKVNNNALYPSASEILKTGTLCKAAVSTQSLNYAHHAHPRTNLLRVESKSEKRLSIPIYPEVDTKPNCNGGSPAHLAPPTPAFESPRKLQHQDSDRITNFIKDEFQNLEKMNGGPQHALLDPCDRRGSAVTVRKIGSVETVNMTRRGRRGTIPKVDGVVRPMYRDDIFLQGSLKRLPQYASQVSSLNYHMSVSRLPTRRDVEEEEKGSFQLCPEAVRRTLATMLDISLLYSPTFLLLGFSGFFTMMGFFVPFMYLKERAEDAGMDAETAVWLIPVIGITNTVGRMACGLLTSLPGVNSLFINNVALTLGGIATIFSGVFMTPSYQFTYVCIFGLAIACFASLRSVIIVDLLGLENLTNAFGLLCLFQGVAAVFGAPLAGQFKVMTNSYDCSFYLSGGLLTLSAIMSYPLNRLNKWEKERNRLKENLNYEMKSI
ncbi:unnamed protein product [Bemisia tabaci]|uniref:Uncharacterized protein n=1 Tax=Bemisia tabaci TaxID=7038 RepID=A0A9P0F863_BEMTA|nr:unnamed protein product [Bemisia tabaci]